jgi:hypothetical protein
MNRNHKIIVSAVLGLFALVGSASFVGAQAGGKAPAAAAPAAAAPAGGVDFRKPAQLSSQDQLTQSSAAVSKMEQGASNIRKNLEQARKDRDVIKTLCLDDKLSQMDVAVRSAKERKQSLQGAITRNDSELSNHEFAIVSVLKQRGEQILAEAAQCIGEESAYTGKSDVKTDVDPNVSVNENGGLPDPIRGPGLTPKDPGTMIDPPQCVSCSI